MTPPPSSYLDSNQCAILALWYEVNASLSAYHKLLSAFGGAQQAWEAGFEAWQALGIHAAHLARHKNKEQTSASIDRIEQALTAGQYQLIFADQSEFPAQLLQIYDPPPLLFCRGNINRLQQAQIAIVGSRKPTAHAQKTTFDIAQYLAQTGYVVTSGLAMGVDKQAHLGALAQTDSDYQGRTVGVMGTGIEVFYPNHHEIFLLCDTKSPNLLEIFSLTMGFLKLKHPYSSPQHPKVQEILSFPRATKRDNGTPCHRVHKSSSKF